MMKAIHLVPYDAVGGVEVAARSIADSEYSGLKFSKLYLVDKKAGESENHPRAYFRTLSDLRKAQPDLVIASLWRCCVVMLIYKLLAPHSRCVTFLHSAHDVHWLDYLFNRLAMCVSDEVWSDSRTTLNFRVPPRWKRKSKVISFLTERPLVPSVQSPSPHFIFWGRLHHQKGLDRALFLFAALARHCPDARYSVIGPDGGHLDLLQRKVRELGINRVDFLGSMDRSDIFRFAGECSFYLQTSRREGMAMSVVEAMQVGLVPIVTPVGEIGTYCVDGYNAILVDDDEDAVQSVLDLLNDPARYRKMAKNASQTWQDKPLYRDDVLAACQHLLEL